MKDEPEARVTHYPGPIYLDPTDAEQPLSTDQPETEWTVEFTIRLNIQAAEADEARERAWAYLEGLEKPLDEVNSVEVS